MRRFRLSRFILISSFIHFIAFYMAYGFIDLHPTVTEPVPIKIGFLTVDKAPGPGNPVVEPPKKEAPLKEAVKPQKKVVKKVVKKKQENKIVTKQEPVKQVAEPVTEEPAAESGEDTAEESTTEIASTEQASTNPGNNSDGEGSSRGTEVGYPDYKSNPKPVYPMIARRNGFEGVVLLKVFVLEDGTVGRVRCEKSSGYDVLDKSASDAVRRWVFVPAKSNRVAVASWVTVPIKFQLNGG